MKSAIVLLSGGLDSTTALYWTKRQTTNVYTLNIQYAQASYQEAAASKGLANAANVKEHLTISLPFYKDIQTRYHPTSAGTVSRAYVPARNLVFYAVAAAYAETMNIDTIIFGSNADDTMELPDATPDFIQHMNDLIKTGTKMGRIGTPASIFNPLIEYNKTEVLRLAINLKVPLELTWSCYEDVKLPCGRCRGCSTRLNAFSELGMIDPLKYASHPFN